MADDISFSELPRLAAELILQDERLTSDLEDAAADALLRWAVDLAGQAAYARAIEPKPLDREALAKAVAPVRGLARMINDLVAARAELDEHEFVQRLLALVDAARQVDRCQ